MLERDMQKNVIDKNGALVLKGIAVLFVILCHFMGHFGKGITLFTPFGGIGVSMFIFLSAYGLNESWMEKGHLFWWRKRLVGVFVPYAIVQLCLFWTQHEFSLFEFLLDISFVKPKYIYGWYLSYLLHCYVIFYLIMRIDWLRKYKIPAFVVLSFFMFFIFDEIRAEQSFSFAAGVLLSCYKNSEKMEKIKNWKAGTAILVLGVLFLALKQLSAVRELPTAAFNFVQLMIKLPCGLGISMIVLDLIRVFNWRLFAFVGGFSYELYLVHGYILYKMPKNHIGVCAFVVITFALALLFKNLLKPVSKLCRRVLNI